MTVSIIGNSSGTKTNNTGTFFFDLLVPGSYEARFLSADITDYLLRSKFFTVSADTYQQVNLYAINSTQANAEVTFLISNLDLEPVEGATVIVSRYYVDQSAYVDIWSRNTDIQGKSVGSFESVNAFYRYRVLFDGETKYESSVGGTQFVGDQTINIYMNTEASPYDDYNDILGIPTSLTFVNTTNDYGIFTYQFSHASTVQGCLKVVENGLQDPFEDESCVTSTGASIQIPVNSTGLTKTYTAVGRLRLNNITDFVVTDTIIITINQKDALSTDSWKDNAAFIALFITILSGLLYIKYPSFAVVLEAVVFLLLTLPPIQLFQVPLTAAVIIVCIALFIANVANRK